MNANEIASKSSARLKRIKIVSRIFRALLGLYVGMLIFIAVSCMMSGLPRNPEGIAPQSFSYFLHHLYIKPSPMPIHVVLIEFFRLGLFIGGMVLLNRLFVLFGNGKFFGDENVRCVRLIGLVITADWLAVFVLNLMNRSVVIGLEPLIGLFVILISWVADEGRKIQEEQVLTV